MLDNTDINHIWDSYREMMAEFSPSVEALSEAEFDEIKKAFARLSASELSGSAWYALRRFLLSVGETPHQDRLHGFSSTKSSTTRNDEEEFTKDASESSMNSPAKSAESPSEQ